MADPVNIDTPLVSCILLTHNRPEFLKQAIKYFKNQKYPNRELIIVDDSSVITEEYSNRKQKINHLILKNKLTIGKKLNLGIEACQGRIIQKLDDDDYYHPNFLSTTVSALVCEDPKNAIVAFDCFLVLILSNGELKFSGNGWSAGGTLCFYKDLWGRTGFREDMFAGTDWQFLIDNNPKKIKIDDPELYIVVRHDINHIWTKIQGTNVTDIFRHKPSYHKNPVDIMGIDNWAFYESIRGYLHHHIKEHMWRHDGS